MPRVAADATQVTEGFLTLNQVRDMLSEMVNPVHQNPDLHFADAVLRPVQVRIHRDTGEAEISPFKSRSKLLVCEECGIRMVSVPVAQAMSDRVKLDWEEFRRLARLCPEYRRKRAVKALGLGAESVTPLEQLQIKV
jgi:hypothetical protein